MVRKRCRTGDGQPVHHKAVGMYFFKVLIGDFHTKLYIPPAFATLIEDDASDGAALNTSVGCYQDIEVLKDNYSMFFHNGWRAFVEHHSLQIGEFLVFRYDGDMQFDVKIFDRSGCEKICFKPVQMDDKKSIPCDPKKSVSPSHGYMCDPEVSRSERDKEVTQDSGRRSTEKCNSSKNFGVKGVSLSDHPAFMSTYRYASRRREVTKEERLQALEKAHSLKLNRPHFTITMFESNVYMRFTVNIPKSFWLKCRLNNEVTLRNSDGMSWQVRCCYYADGHAKFMRGWGPFSLANNLEEGDVCVFELTHEHSAMDVHIFRVVDEITAPFPCGKLPKKSSKQKKG